MVMGDETCHIQEMWNTKPADGNFYGSQWDNGEIHKEEIEMHQLQKSRLFQTEEVPMHHIFPEQMSMEKEIQERSRKKPGKKDTGAEKEDPSA